MAENKSATKGKFSRYFCVRKSVTLCKGNPSDPGSEFREVFITSDDPVATVGVFQTYAIRGFSRGALASWGPLCDPENTEKLFDDDYRELSAANEKADALVAEYRREGFEKIR